MPRLLLPADSWPRQDRRYSIKPIASRQPRFQRRTSCIRPRGTRRSRLASIRVLSANPELGRVTRPANPRLAAAQSNHFGACDNVDWIVSPIFEVSPAAPSTQVCLPTLNLRPGSRPTPKTMPANDFGRGSSGKLLCWIIFTGVRLATSQPFSGGIN